MAQYTEGQRLQGSDGQVYVVQNGVPVRADSVTPQMPADPTFPFQGAKAAADTTRAQADATVASATTEAQIRKANAEAAAAQAKANEAIASANAGGGLTPGRKKADETFAVDYAAWTAGGGFAGLENKLSVLSDALDILEGSDTITGPVFGRLPKFLQQMVDPRSQDVRADVEKAIQETLRQTLGAQFTAKEGESILARTYDPTQQEASNARRARNLIKELRTQGVAKDSAARFFEQNGTISGWTAPRAGQAEAPKDDRRAPPVLEQPGFAPGSAAEKSIPIPQPMQDEHASYLAQNWGRLDQNAYAEFRASLDSKYGFGSRPDAYRAIVPDLNNRAAQGGSPDGLNIPPVNAKMDGLDQINASVFNNKAGGFIFGAGDQLGVADELAGGFNSLVKGTDYDVEVARANAMKQGMQDAYPGMNLTGNIVGALATGAGAAKAFPGLSSALTGTTGRAIGTGAAFGGVSGAGEMNDDRMTGLAIGTGLGVAGGGAGAAASPIIRSAMDTQTGQALSRGGRSVWNNTAGKITPSMRVAAAPVVPQFRKGEGLLPAEVLESAIPNLQDADRLGMPYALADANPQLRALAGSVSRRSVDARQLAEDTFIPRAFGQADRATDAIDQRLAPQTDIAGRRNQLLDAGNAASEPLYRQADEVRTPVDPELQALLRSSSGQEALARAKSIMSDRGVPDTDKRIFFGPDNLLTVEHTPNFQTLDYIKKGFDAKLSEARNPVTGELDLRGNPQLQAVNDLRKRYIGALDRINPAYQEARSTYAPFAQRAEALDMGYSAPATNIRPRDLEGAINRLSPEQLPEYQRGFATKLIDDTNATRFSGNPYDRIAGSPQQQEKLGMVFPEGAADFQRIGGLERDMSRTAYETTGGSPTAMRQATDQQFDSGMMGIGTDLAADAAGGGGAFTLKSMIGRGARAMGDTARIRGGKAKADAIAPVLYAPDPRMTLDYLADLQARQAQAASRAGAYRRRGGLFGAILPSAFLGSE